jgi:hypothetical protein
VNKIGQYVNRGPTPIEICQSKTELHLQESVPVSNFIITEVRSENLNSPTVSSAVTAQNMVDYETVPDQGYVIQEAKELGTAISGDVPCWPESQKADDRPEMMEDDIEVEEFSQTDVQIVYGEHEH